MDETLPKRLVVCMVESMPDEELLAQGATHSSDMPDIDRRLTTENVYKYKGVHVSKYHCNAGIGYVGKVLVN